MRMLSSWHPDYLLDRSMEPLEPEYGRYVARQRGRKMRAEKHPDLIVSADRATGPQPGVTRVWTADGEQHLVTSESYLIRSPHLLSKCVLYQEEIAA